MQTHKLVFTNDDAGPHEQVPDVIEIICDRASLAKIACWYGAFHAGDAYVITVDGKHVEHDLNGEIDGTLAAALS
jgi:hypothetical protein